MRTSVERPAGAEWIWPKQWQSGCSPRDSARAIPAMNAASRIAAARAPQRADGAGTSATAIAISASGSSRPTTRAARSGDAEVRHSTPRAGKIAQLSDARGEKDSRQHHP